MIVGEKRSWFTFGLGKPVALLRKATSQPDASSGRGEKYKLPAGVRAGWLVRIGRDHVLSYAWKNALNLCLQNFPYASCQVDLVFDRGTIYFQADFDDAGALAHFPVECCTDGLIKFVERGIRQNVAAAPA